MDRSNLKRIQVVFNCADPDQLRLYEYAAQRTNHSGFFKRLLQRDMDGAYMPAAQPAREQEKEVPINADGFF